MAIKWDDVHVRTGALTGTIYIGKVKKDKKGNEIFTDKSGDKTDECVKAVMEHMMGEIKENGTMAYTIEGKCELRITNLGERKLEHELTNYERLVGVKSVEEIAKIINEAWDYVVDSELTDMEQGLRKWLSI